MKAYHSFKGSLELTTYNFMKHFSLPQALSHSLSHMDTCAHIHSNRPLLQTEIKGECALLIFMNGHLHLALAKATKANCFSKIVFYVKMPPKKGSHKIKMHPVLERECK